uniref:Uncharacterized protein n=1 Tax=Bionectria ochroleuca TaxID=29856 RepID=A0A8H7TRJ1_BIOOC
MGWIHPVRNRRPARIRVVPAESLEREALVLEQLLCQLMALIPECRLRAESDGEVFEAAGVLAINSINSSLRLSIISRIIVRTGDELLNGGRRPNRKEGAIPSSSSNPPSK